MYHRVTRMLSRLLQPDVRNFAIYGIATGLAAMLTLVQTRVLWRALSPRDFGIWALIDPMLLPLASLVLFGIDHSIVKQLRVDRLPLRVVTGYLLTSTVPATAVCLLITGLIAQLGFRLAWTQALVLTMAGEALILMMQTAFRATGAVALFAAVLLARNALYLGLLLLILATSATHLLPIGLVFLTRGACVIAVSVVALAVMRPVLKIDWARYRDAFRYGFPLLLSTFIYALADMTDRWFLTGFNGVVAVGIYALHLKVAAILSQAIVIPFGLWFPPERFKRLYDPDEGRGFFIRTAIALALICGYLSGAVWLARDLVFSLVAPGAPASPFVLACCLGGVACLALSQALNVGLLMPGHTGKNVFCIAYALAATVLAAALLVPLMGIDGAAAGRLVGGLVLVTATAARSNRVLPVAFPFVEIGLYAVACGIVGLAINRGITGHGLLGILVGLVVWTIATCLLGMVFWYRLRASGHAEKQPRHHVT